MARGCGRMINSVFVMSGTGEVLIEKHYRGVISRTCCDLFWNEVLGATACFCVLWAWVRGALRDGVYFYAV